MLDFGRGGHLVSRDCGSNGGFSQDAAVNNDRPVAPFSNEISHKGNFLSLCIQCANDDNVFRHSDYPFVP